MRVVAVTCIVLIIQAVALAVLFGLKIVKREDTKNGGEYRYFQVFHLLFIESKTLDFVTITLSK